jgi:hypothetical protein
VQFDTKIAIVLDEQLACWQKSNVTSFLISGIACTDTPLVGEPYLDASGNRYLPMCRQPIMVYAADPARLRRAYERAMARKVERLAIFTRDLFATPHDEANRAAVASVPAAELDFAGIAFHADRRTVDKGLAPRSGMGALHRLPAIREATVEVVEAGRPSRCDLELRVGERAAPRQPARASGRYRSWKAFAARPGGPSATRREPYRHTRVDPRGHSRRVHRNQLGGDEGVESRRRPARPP